MACIHLQFALFKMTIFSINIFGIFLVDIDIDEVNSIFSIIYFEIYWLGHKIKVLDNDIKININICHYP